MNQMLLKTSPIHKKSLNKCPKIIDKLTQEKTHLHRELETTAGEIIPVLIDIFSSLRLRYYDKMPNNKLWWVIEECGTCVQLLAGLLSFKNRPHPSKTKRSRSHQRKNNKTIYNNMMHVLSPSKSADCRAGNEISVPGSGFCSFWDCGVGWLAGGSFCLIWS